MSALLEIEEILTRFKREFVVIDRCRFNEGLELTHGRIVATSDDRDEIYDTLRKTPNSVVIYAGPAAREREGAYLDGGEIWRTWQHR